MQEPELLRVEWLDSNTHDGWHDPKAQEYSALPISSVGFLIFKDDHCVVLAPSASWGEHYQVCSTMTIPRGCITSITKIG